MKAYTKVLRACDAGSNPADIQKTDKKKFDPEEELFNYF